MSSIVARVEDNPSSDITTSSPTTTVNHPVSTTLKYKHGNSIKVLSCKRRRWLKFPWKEPNEGRAHMLRPGVAHCKSISFEKHKTHVSDLVVDPLSALETQPAYLTHDEKEEVRGNDANEPEEVNEMQDIPVPMHVSYSCLVEFELCYRLKHAC